MADASEEISAPMLIDMGKELRTRYEDASRRVTAADEDVLRFLADVHSITGMTELGLVLSGDYPDAVDAIGHVIAVTAKPPSVRATILADRDPIGAHFYSDRKRKIQSQDWDGTYYFGVVNSTATCAFGADDAGALFTAARGTPAGDAAMADGPRSARELVASFGDLGAEGVSFVLALTSTVEARLAILSYLDAGVRLVEAWSRASL